MDLNRRNPLGRRVVLALAALAPALAYGGVRPEAGLGLPRDASVHGHLIDSLMDGAHVLDLVLFAIVCAWMGYACLKHGRRHQAVYDHGDSRKSITVVLAISAAIFLVLDGNFFVNTLRDLNGTFWNFRTPAEDPRTVRIEVNAHQWAWDVRYAGADGKFGTKDDVVTWNELRIPADVPISVQLTSTDVIHALNLPNFRQKMDAVPGQVNRLWFQARPEVAGEEFEFACAQHCGTNHYKMRGVLTVVRPDEFNAWAQEASINAERAYDPDDAQARWGWEWKEP
jgi:cytochrome c oxidase subunit 2